MPPIFSANPLLAGKQLRERSAHRLGDTLLQHSGLKLAQDAAGIDLELRSRQMRVAGRFPKARAPRSALQPSDCLASSLARGRTPAHTWRHPGRSPCIWPSGLVKVNDGPWWTSTDQPGAGSDMGSFRHPSQGSLGSLAGSFWSGIASYPRKFGPDGPADSLADRTSAGGLRQALDKFAVLFAGRKTDHDPDGVGGIGGRSASTARHIQPR